MLKRATLGGKEGAIEQQQGVLVYEGGFVAGEVLRDDVVNADEHCPATAVSRSPDFLGDGFVGNGLEVVARNVVVSLFNMLWCYLEGFLGDSEVTVGSCPLVTTGSSYFATAL